MRPSPATQHLLRIGFWHEQVRYCITVALEARRRNVIALNADWWLDRAKLHAQAYASTPRPTPPRTENSEPRTKKQLRS